MLINIIIYLSNHANYTMIFPEKTESLKLPHGRLFTIFGIA